MQLGKAVALMHNANVIHGDLTTSNVLRRADGRLVAVAYSLDTANNVVRL